MLVSANFWGWVGVERGAMHVSLENVMYTRRRMGDIWLVM